LSFLHSIGLSNFTIDDVFSSGYTTALYLKCQNILTVFVCGSPGLCAELTLHGIEVHTLATDPEPKQVDAVVCAKGDQFRYDEITRCIYLVKKCGARLIGTNPDPNFPVAHDVLVLGSGAVAGAVEAGTGVVATMIGKPEDPMFFMILEALGMTVDEVMMVGDRWITDIAFAARHGARSVLVLSGVDTEDDVRDVPAELRPTYVLPSLVEVASLVEELNGLMKVNC
jgi:4-nitrophenyl phosphatase